MSAISTATSPDWEFNNLTTSPVPIFGAYDGGSRATIVTADSVVRSYRSYFKKFGSFSGSDRDDEYAIFRGTDSYSLSKINFLQVVLRNGSSIISAALPMARITGVCTHENGDDSDSNPYPTTPA